MRSFTVLAHREVLSICSCMYAPHIVDAEIKVSYDLAAFAVPNVHSQRDLGYHEVTPIAGEGKTVDAGRFPLPWIKSLQNATGTGVPQNDALIAATCGDNPTIGRD